MKPHRPLGPVVASLLWLATGLALPASAADEPVPPPKAPKPARDAGEGAGTGAGSTTPPAAPKVERLVDVVRPFAATFGASNADVPKLVSGPKAVAMPNDKSPGRQWVASLGTVTFKVTIADATKLAPADVFAHVRRLPVPYRRMLEIVSEDGKAGLAVYPELGGAAAHGSQDYLNVIPQANVFVLVHECGHVLEQRTTRGAPKTLETWAEAVAKDRVSVSEYGDTVVHEDLAEFALVYAICLDAGPARLDDLRRRSPTRFAQWEHILEASGAVERPKDAAPKAPNTPKATPR